MDSAALIEQEEIKKTRAGIRLMKLDVIEIKAGLDLIKTALLGSPLTQDGGLIKRVVEMETRQDKLTIQMNEMEKELANRINDLEKTQGTQGVNLSNNQKIGLGIFFALLAGLIAYLQKK